MHSNGILRLPPGCIFMGLAKTSGTPALESGSSITVDPLACIIFCVPSGVQMTHTKFMAVKLVPSMTGLDMSTNYEILSEWCIINCKSTGYLTKSTHVFSSSSLYKGLVSLVTVLA